MEWLTTGQLIDTLKMGEMAESEHHRFRIKRSQSGFIFVDKEGCLLSSWGSDGYLIINSIIQTVKWRILPQFISFEEAMKALKEGELVYFHDGDWKGKVVYGQYLEDSPICGYTFANLICGKWTIEGE